MVLGAALLFSSFAVLFFVAFRRNFSDRFLFMAECFIIEKPERREYEKGLKIFGSVYGGAELLFPVAKDIT